MHFSLYKAQMILIQLAYQIRVVTVAAHQSGSLKGTLAGVHIEVFSIQYKIRHTRLLPPPA
jgi:hypothetical protein